MTFLPHFSVDPADGGAHPDNVIRVKTNGSAPPLPSESGLIRALADSATVAIYHADTSGRLTYANPRYREMFGLSPGQSLDDWARAMHPIDRPRIEALWAEFFQSQSVSTQFEYRTLNGDRIRYMAESVVAISDEAIAGFVGTITDVTELKSAQAALESMHKQLIDASRLAGRAEVASSVLHNVGNVLNSVNVSADLVSSRIKNSKLTELQCVVDLLKAHEADLPGFFGQDGRGKRLPGYMDRLAQQASADHQQIVAELSDLRKGIDHIKQIVAMQQDYSKLGAAADVVDLYSLIDDTLRLSEAEMARHGVVLKKNFDKLPKVVLDEHRVLQILFNLIRNAKHACSESGKTERIVTVSAAVTGDGLQISVRDNGVGISEEILTKIFHYGFTTRKNGHGFGLHSAAVAARELGGELRVESAGPGLGALFTLDLPLTKAPNGGH
jgi:PAS domain S-box-containing protein